MARRTRLSRRAREYERGDLVLPGYLLLCLLFGGSSYAGFVPNALVQIVGLAVLAWRASSADRRGLSSMGRFLGGLTLVYAGWTVLTLVPLPAGVWTHAGGRGFLSASYAALGIATPMRPLSLDPDRTIASALALVPFLAVLTLTLAATDRSRAAAIGVAIGVAIASVPIGALQLLGGGGSAWYFYSPTNIGNAVGFFANANHLATLFLMVLPLIAALAARARSRASGDRRVIVGEVPLAGVFAFAVVGLLMAGSVAGWLLLLPAVAGSALVWRRGIGRPVPTRWVGGASALLAVAVLFAVFGPARGLLLNQALAGGTDPVTREVSMTLTARAAHDFLPFGSGLGTFRRLYTRYEDPNAVTVEFNVHTHNDYLELALEQGVVGIAVVALFLLWYARRTAAVWSGGAPKGSIARAASVALGMLLLHSLVDFPARTAAIAALAGFCIAVLQAPQPRISRRRNEEDEAPAPAIAAPGRHLSV